MMENETKNNRKMKWNRERKEARQKERRMRRKGILQINIRLSIWRETGWRLCFTKALFFKLKEKLHSFGISCDFNSVLLGAINV